jgi:ABC-type glycerol-3-phosphate transport system substrate-binding protein
MSNPRDEVTGVRRLRESLVHGDIDRRTFLKAAAGLSASALLAACGGGLENDRAGGGNVIPLYTVENDPKTLAFYNMVIAQFKDKHPDVDVKVTVYSDSTQLQYLTTAFQNQVDVGIFSPPVSQFSDWAAKGYLAVLDDLVSDIGVEEFLPGTRVVIGGHDYAMPLQSNSHPVYYRKDLLQREGLRAPTTYDEYLQAIRATHGRDGRIGIAMALGATPQLPLFSFSPYIFQSGWDYHDVEGNVTFGEPEVFEAVQRFVAVMRYSAPSLYNAEYGDIVNAYSSGQAAFAPFPGRLGVTLWERAPDIAEVSGVIPIPAGPFMTGKLHFGSGQQYGVYAKTGNLALAKEFLKLITTGDNAVEFALGVPGHLLPPLRSAREAMLTKVRTTTDPALARYREWIETFAGLTPTAMTASVSMGAVNAGKFERKITNLCPWAGEIWKSPPVDGAMLQDILINRANPRTAFDAATATMKKASDTWRAANPQWKPEPV